MSFSEPIVDVIEIPRTLDCEKEDLFYSKEDIRRFKEERYIAIQMNQLQSLIARLKKKDDETLLTKFKNAFSFGHEVGEATSNKSFSRAA